MAAQPQPLTPERPAKKSAWKELAAHYKTLSKQHLRELFANDPERGQRMAIRGIRARRRHRTLRQDRSLLLGTIVG